MRKFLLSSQPIAKSIAAFTQPHISKKLSTFLLISLALFGTTGAVKAQDKCVTGVTVSPGTVTPVCVGSTASTLTATITTSGSDNVDITYQWFRNTDSSTVGSIAVPPPITANTISSTNDFIPPTTSAGVLWYYCTVTKTTGTCTGTIVSNAVKVEVTVLPPAPTGTAAQSFCVSNNPTVASLTATGTDIKWYATSSLGPALASTDALISGSTYYASQTINGCESVTRLPVTATVVANPSVPTGTSAQSFCTSINPTVASLTATGSAIKWYATSTLVTALASTDVLVSGNTYYATQTINGCESVTRLPITATVVANPSVPTGTAAQSFCAINIPTVASLIATGSSILWYSASSGGSPLATTTVLATGTHYFASQTVGGCESITRLDVTAAVGNPSAPTGTATQSFCISNNPTVANLTTATGTAIKWYSGPTGGPALASTAALATGTYYASQTTSGCESATRFGVAVTVNSPAAPTGAPTQSFCISSNPTVANLTATGTAIKWYTSATGGTALVATTALVSGHYYASQTPSTCEGTNRLDVTVIINSLPTITLSPANPTICAGVGVAITASGAATYSWGPATGLSATTGTTVTANPFTNTTYTVIGTDANGCINNTTTTVTVVNSVSATLVSQASAAFSLRKLNCAYAGSAIAVTRSDNAIQNIGFTATGDLDTVALKLFVGATSGFISTWYDQTGNGRHAVQTTSGNQPRIVNAGLIERINGKPSIRWTGTSQLLQCSTSTTVQTVNAVRDLVDLTNYQTLFALPANTDFSVRRAYTDGPNGNDWITGSSTTNWVNGVPTLAGVTSLHTITASAASAKVGNFSISSSFMSRGMLDNSHLSEMILFPTVLTSTDRQNLECNQRDMYILPNVANVCTAFPFTVTPSAPTGTTYSWGLPVISPIGAITGATTGTGATNLTQTLVSAVNGATATYNITPSPSCSGKPFAVTITVYQTATANAGAGIPAICQGTTSAALGGSFGGAASSAIWSDGGAGGSFTNNGGATPNTATYTASATSAATVTLTLTASSGGGSCVATSSKTITVYPNPTVDAGPVPADICRNSTTAALGGSFGGGATSAIWTDGGAGGTFANNSGSTPGTATYTASATAPSIVTLRLTSVGGLCGTIFKEKSLNVNLEPVGSPLTIAENSGNGVNDNTICAGAPVTFTAPAGNGNNYTFTVGGVSYSNGTSNDFNTSTLFNAQTVTVQIFGDGCSRTFTYPTPVTVNPLPTATISASLTAICPGETITFTAPDAGVGSIYTFKTNGTNVVYTGGSRTLTTAALPNTTFYITVDITNANGCTVTSPQTTVTVNPVSTGTLTATATSFCAGTSVTFSATTGFNNYEFKVNGTTVQGPVAANTYTTAALTNGQVVSVVAKNGTSCLTTFNSLPVTVNPFPIATLSVTETSGTADDGIICAGGVSTTLTATAGFANYNFKVNGVSQQSSSSNVFTRTNFANNDVITVDVTSSAGCTTSAAASKTITVVAPPSGTLTIPSNTICFGDNAVFTASAGFTNYNFKVNGSTVQNGTANIYTNLGTLTNGQTVTVIVTGTNACVSTFSAGAMIVNPLPTGSLIATETSGVSANDYIICAGAPVTFTSSAAFSNYRFLLNGIQVQNGPSNNYINSTLNTGDDVKMEVTNSNGCKSTFTAPPIVVKALPVVDPIVSSSGAVVCEGATLALTNASAGGVWSGNNNAIATVNAATGLVTGVLAGTVTISYTVTNGNGCASKSDFIITVNPLPVVAPITQSGGLNQVCVGITLKLDNTTPGGFWSSSNSLIATVGNSGKVAGILAGSVTISYTITNGFGCSKVSTYLVTVNALPVLPPITGVFSVCANGSTTLSNALTGPGTYIWSSNDRPKAEIDSLTGVVTGVSAGTVTMSYKYTDLNGCLTTIYSQPVVVNPVPVPTLSGPNPICVGSTETYTTESAPGLSAYVWNVVGGTINAGGQSTDATITVNWNAATTKTININYSNSFGCTASTSSSFTTAPPANQPTISGPGTACLNATGNSYATKTGQIDYIWTVTGGTITPPGNTASILVTWNTVGTRSVSVNYSDITSGCNAANPTIKTVAVFPLPTATISVNKTAVCQNGTNPVITFTGAGGLANYTFTYTITSNGVLGAPQTITSPIGNSIATITVSALTPTLVPDIYTLVSVQDARSCANPQTGAVSITINPLPTVVTNNIAVCTPATANLTLGAVTTGSTPGITSFGYFTDAGATNLYPTPAAATAGTYYIKGITAGGCYDTKAVTVTVNPLPTASVAGTASVCIGGTSPNITFTGANGTAPYTFIYNINGGASSTVTTSTGNSVTVAAPTITAGSFAYNLLSVQDASSTACLQAQTGTATITVNPVSIGGAVDGTATVCSGSNGATINLGGQTGSVIRWESSVNAGTSWLPIANTTTSFTYTNITQTTWYRVVVQSGVCTSANSNASIITVNAVSVGGTAAGDASVCAGSNTGTINLTGNNASVVRWEMSVNGGLNWSSIVNTTTSLTYTNITQTTIYRAVVKNGVCGEANSTNATITVKARPTGVISGTIAKCAGETATLTIAVTGLGTISGTLSDGSAFSGTAPVITKTVTPAATITYTIATLSDANCTALAGDKTGSATVTINPLPVAPVLKPVSATFCEGTIMPLSAATSFTTTTATFPSGAISLAIPDNDATGAAATVAVSGIPAGAIINSVDVLFKISHTKVGDLVINVKAPNSKVLNLVNREGLVGDNFNTTTISSTGTTSIVGQAAPFNATYKAEATFNVDGATVVPGNISNTTSFASLFDTPNGNWTLSAKDIAAGTAGTIDNWSVIINYSVGVPPVPVVWAPVTGLYKDAGATVPYAGETLATVYAKPTAGTKVYSATNTSVANCSISNNVTLTVNPVPVVSIQAFYCLVPGKVRLTATSNPVGASFVWSTGQITATIEVDVADVYDVVATLGGCASTTTSFSVAQELVVNGDFTAGNTGFISGYAYKPDIPGVNTELVPDNANNGYAVGVNGQDYHPNFWGQDHTNNQTGPRNFMLVNGHDNITIWEQTVSVLPNTDYYFSAWAMNINGGNPAQLRFQINGNQVGTTADLSTAPRPGSNDAVNLSNWVRFYSNPTWNSGTATNATIRIVNLNGSLGGNDFGLDDISFGTLSTFITLESAAGTDAQNICVGDAIVPIQYNIGSGLPPTVSTLPAGLTAVFNGVNLIISGTPTIPGDYAYSITATGCGSYTANGTIKIKSQKIDITAGTSSQTTCKAALITPLKYTISGEATGATVAGLPAGVTMTNSGKVYTIAGTPTVAGVYNYTVTTTGACTPVTATGTITVQEQTISLAAGNKSPTLCINTALPANIEFATGGTATGATLSGSLPTGVTGIYNSGFFIISGTPTQAGTFNYTVTTVGTCALATSGITGTITVSPAASIALTTGNAAQTPCLNAPIVSIQYTVAGGGTGATVTGLPNGVTGSFAGAVFTIAGTPTETGSFNYTVTTTGTCAQTQASGTITVLTQEIDLTNGTTPQTLCINTAITPIIYTISGAASGITVVGLPAGVGVSNVSKVYTISGTPTVSGTFNYTITTSGSCSPVATAIGSLTVQSQTITLTTANNIQTPCVNLPINNIVYTISGGATGASVTGLPAGITGAYSNGVFTISGTTALSGTFNYTITTTGACTSATATGTLVTGSVIWTGANNTNWSDANNWSCGLVPVAVTNVVIPTGVLNMPLLTATSVTKDIQLQPGTTLDLNGQSFTAFGSVSGTGKIKGSAASNLNLAATGSSTLIFDQTTDGATNAVKNLTINGATNNVTIGNKLAVYGTLLPVAGTLNLNDELVLRSTAAGTARVGEVSGTIAYTVTGKVTVERFYPMSRSWRLVTSPLSGAGNIFNSWQNSGVESTGKGMFVTGPAPSGAGGNGLDYSGFNNYSMKGWNSLTSSYVNVGNTITTKLSDTVVKPGIATNIGYYAFVRGDRRRSPDNTIFGNMNNTTLSSTGKLQTGPQSFHFNGVVSGTARTFELIGNPYASSIDFTKLTKSNVNPLRYYIFDPSLGTVGLFITMEDYDMDGVFKPTPSGSSQSNYVQSSQAFFAEVENTGAAVLTFKETDKSADYNPLLFRPVQPSANMQSLRVNLLQSNADNSSLLVDGTFVQFDDRFDDKVDLADALKFTNITENLSIKRYNQLLAVERRPFIQENDTIFLQLSKTTQRNYQFRFEPTFIDASVTAFLEDSYTKQITPLNMLENSTYHFGVNADAKSSVVGRFRIVFKQTALGPLPVTFKTVKAAELAGNIAVDWTVENELNIKQYEVEKSAAGQGFVTLHTRAATSINSISKAYRFIDENPFTGNNFYRIKSIDADGKFDYSNTVLVKMGKQSSGIRIYPNPVTDVIGAEFKNMTAGIYAVRLLNALGQTVLSKTVNHAPGTSMETIQPDYKLLSGIYQLEVTSPAKETTMVKVIVK